MRAIMSEFKSSVCVSCGVGGCTSTGGTSLLACPSSEGVGSGSGWLAALPCGRLGGCVALLSCATAVLLLRLLRRGWDWRLIRWSRRARRRLLGLSSSVVLASSRRLIFLLLLCIRLGRLGDGRCS